MARGGSEHSCGGGAGWRVSLIAVAAMWSGLMAWSPSPYAAEPPSDLGSIAEARAMARAAEAEHHVLVKEVQRLEQRMTLIEKRAKVHVLGREFAESLVEEQLALPDPADFRAGQQARASLLQRVSSAQLRVEREIDDLAEKAQRLSSLAAGASDPAVTEVVRRRDELAELSQVQARLIEALRDTDHVTDKLLHVSKTAETRLKQLMFWIPAPVGPSTWSELLPSLAWMFSFDNWRRAANITCDECRSDPVLAAGGVALLALLVLGHRRMRERLYAVVARSRERGGIRKRELLQAMLITAALPAPLPLAMLLAGRLVDTSPGFETFAASLGDALLAMPRLVYAIGVLTWMVDPRGIGVAAGRDPQVLAFISRTLRTFLPGFIAVLFIAALNGLDDAPFSNRESLGRLAFAGAMLMLAGLLLRLFRRQSPLISRLSEVASRGWIIQFRPFWLVAMMALPLLFAGFALAGYFVAAEYFFGRLVATFFALLAAVIVRDFLYWWLSAAGVGRDDLPVATRAGPAVDEEKRSLINLLLMVLVVVGLWGIWRSGLPVLAAIGDYTLYSYTSTVNGKQVVHPLSIEGFAIGIIVALLTWVIVRNIGGLLDMVLLRRIDMQADASFAIKVVSRYLVIIVGVVVATSALGLGWDDVQWLVAALSVGIGFGLQEICGNLVAGLMMLAERPVRIGDIVTVGDVTGTVTKIQARATTVTDFDNKEILIPNKSFITDRVINWTLSNQTTRLLIKISVPRGTDVGRAQQVLLDVVRANRDVSSEIPPAVLCLGLVDRALEFEVSAFVDSFDKRRRVQHELNGAIDRALRESGIVG